MGKKFNPNRIRAFRRDVGDVPITVALDMPPSTNHLFANTAHGRTLSAKYKAWRKKNGQHLWLQNVGRMAGPVFVDIILEDKHPRRDADNALKPLLDFISSPDINIIDGDHATVVRSIHVRWGNADGARISILRDVARAA